MSNWSRYDVVIAGGRCAGAATALLLARAGLSVLVVERGRRGTDTLSTHALMRPAVLQMHRWGLLDRIREAGTPPVRRVVFEYSDGSVDVPIKPREGVDALFAPRRTLLDALLADEAARAGANVTFGARIVDVARNAGGRVTGVIIEDRPGLVRKVEAGLVIGADGADSTIARLVEAPMYRRGTAAGAVIYGYWPGLPQDEYRWMFRDGYGAGAIPTNGGLTCLFASAPADRLFGVRRSALRSAHLDAIAAVSPTLADAVGSTAPDGQLRGFAGRAGFMRQSWGPGWALVGDAGYFKDPITAHGITDALRDAELLAGAIVGDNARAFADYQSARDDLSNAMFEATEEIAAYAWTTNRLRELHQQISREMQREAYTVGQWTLPRSSTPTDGDSPGPSTNWFRSSTRTSGGSLVRN